MCADEFNNMRGACHVKVLCLEIGRLAGGSSCSGKPPRRERACALEILVEAEAFDHYGGWALDQQFMDQMGSPYLLAHGLGEPVTDATTKVHLPRAGTYQCFVRTKDWVAPWKAKGSPGRFQVLVNGKPLAATFGTEGAQWHWQPGGAVDLPAGEVTLALHDLTGFEGRCDAIVFRQSAEPPPNGPAETGSVPPPLAQHSREAGRWGQV